MTSKPRVVFDTNVIVSAAIVKASLPRKALDRALDEGKALISLDTMTELREVLLRPSFDKYITQELRLEFLDVFLQEVEVVEVTQAVTDCRDARDNKFLENPCKSVVWGGVG